MKNCKEPMWQPPVFIITGEQGKGKTSFLMEIIAELEENGITIRGIVAPGYFKNGLRSGFSVLDVATGLTEELCSVTPSSDCIQHGQYYFRSKGVSFGNRALKSSLIPGENDLYVIDEVGKFELMGNVWADSIDQVVTMSCRPPMIWTVRSSLVDAAINRWSITRDIILEVGMTSREEAIRNLLEEIRMYRLSVR